MNYKELLLKHDKKGSFEFPKNFDYELLNKRFHNVLNELNVKLDQSFEIEEGLLIQDASFHADIILQENKEETGIYRTVLRFSNFGNFVTLSDFKNISEDWKNIIFDILEKQSFIYIPLEYLYLEYDGCEAGKINSWWIRYFDYL